MTDQGSSPTSNGQGPQFGMQALWRLALWGGFAAVALFVAVIATFSGASIRSATSAPPQRNAGPDFGLQLEETVEETRRLTEAVQALSSDRDQLLARMAVLERNIDSTGSTRRDRVPGGQSPAPQPAAAQPPPASPQAAPQTVSQAPPAASAQPPSSASLSPPPASTAGPIPAARPDPAGAPPWETAALAPQPSAPARAGASEIAKTIPKTPAPDASPIASASDPAHTRGDQPGTSGLGVDVGSAANYDGLRALWHSTKNNDPGLLDDLFPVVAARENGKTHGAELRLILGPMADVESAARLCADLQAAHQYCQPVAFEGQPLSLNESAPPSKTASSARHRGVGPPAPPIPSVLKSAPEPSPYAKLTK